MTVRRPEELATRPRQITVEDGSRRQRRRSNLTLIKDVLIALALLAGIGTLLSIGSSGLELIAFG